MTPLPFLFRNVFTYPAHPLWPVSPYGSHLGAAGGAMCLPHYGPLPPLQGIFLTHSLGGVPGLLGFPPASWYRAALQATRVTKLVSFLACGEGLLPGLGGVRNPTWERGWDTVAQGPEHQASSLPASDLAWGQHMPSLVGMVCSCLQASILTYG